jgi:signal transduction histidine kinase
VVLIDDVREDTPWARGFRQDVAPQVDPELLGVRSWLGAPLFLHDRIIGVLALTSGTERAFDERQTALVQAIGAQAAVAIDNARLYEQSQQQARETEALLRADEELFRSLDLDEVLHALVDVTIDVMRADKCILTLVEAGEEHVVASRNFSAEGLVSIDRQVRERSRSGVKPPDHPFVLNNIDEERRPAAREMWESEGIRSYMALPIRAAGQLIGGFGVAYTSPHRFGEGERRVFQALAERGGAAIQNAELYERAQHAASLEERQRLARELHDSVSQALYGIALGARTARTQLDRDPALAVEPVDYVLSLAEAGLAEMRALIFELRPESLELEGIVAGLEKQAAALRARHGIEVDADLCSEPDAPLAIKEAVSRIAQEAMHNTVKHARATRVSVRLCSDDGHLSLQVSDNGRGFDTSQPYAGHLGLRSMRERAEKLGGTFEVTSEPGAGSRITVSIPVPTPAT